MRRLALALVAILGLAAFLLVRSCGDDPAPPPQRQYEVYIDVSMSAASRLEGPISAAALGLVETALEEEAVITLHELGASTASAAEIASTDFGAPPVEGDYYQRGWRQDERTRLEDAIVAWRSTVEIADGTDLVGALVNASGPAQAQSGREVIVVLISDGLNYTPEWTWSDGPLDAGGCGRLPSELGLPSLDGATVWIRTGGHPQLPAAQSVKVEECWEALVHAVDGRTPPGWFSR